MNFRFLSSLLLTSYAVADDILDIATDPVYNGLFDTLVVALDSAGLASAFDSPSYCQYSWSKSWCKEYTVFAPTNDAFGNLLDGTVDRLLDEDFLPHLRDLLLYHVVDGEIFSSDITDAVEVRSKNGETIVANVNESTITINTNAEVIVPDVDASNGVVHAVNNVLIPTSAAKNIAEVAATDDDFSIFVSLVTDLGLVDYVYNPESKLTIFAPTNDAFLKLIDSGFDTSDSAAVADVLKYHILEDTITTSGQLKPGLIPTVQGGDISVDIMGHYWSGYEIELNGSVKITKANILASNGIIHAIDTVLTPPGDLVDIALGNPDFSDLVEALTKAELVSTLQGVGPFTVFAPTNDAFLKAGIDVSTATKEELTPILLYHVLAGSKVFSEDLSSTVIQTNPITPTNLIVDVLSGWFWSSKHITLNDDISVVATDIDASNGVIHVIDNVLLPPGSIVDIAVGDPSNFSTLVSLLSAEGVDLVPTLSGNGPFTVFAPTNEAFERLGDLDLTTDQLKSVLLYHVSPGNNRFSDIVHKNELDTAFESEGVIQTIEVIIKKSWWQITGLGVKGDANDAESRIIAQDIFAANGFIHAIDEVLLPNFPTSTPPPPPCKTVQTLDEFDIVQYASKKWYSHQQRPVQFNSETYFYCISAEYSFLDPNNVPFEPLGIENGFDIKVFNKGQDVDGNVVTSDDEIAEGGIPVPSPLCAGQSLFDGDKNSELTVGFCAIPSLSFRQSNYWVLAYDEEDGAALIAGGQPDTPNSNGDGLCTYSDNIKGLWIFTRSPVRDEALIEKYRNIARENGIDPSMMLDVVQEGCDDTSPLEPSTPSPTLSQTTSPTASPTISETPPPPCKTVQTLDEFDIVKYASKKWYSHQQRPVQFNSETYFYCISAEYSFLDSNNIPFEPLGIQNGFDIRVFNKGQDLDGNVVTSDDEIAEGGIPVPSPLCAGQSLFDGDKNSELTIGFCAIPSLSFRQSNYWVLAYDEEEGAALIAGGQPDTPNSNGDGLCTYSDNIKGLWIFTRSPVRNEALIEKYRNIARENGIDPSMMLDVVQEECDDASPLEPIIAASLRGTLPKIPKESSSEDTTPGAKLEFSVDGW